MVGSRHRYTLVLFNDDKRDDNFDTCYIEARSQIVKKK